MNLGIFYFSLASLVVSPGSGVTQDVPPSATGSALLEQCIRGAPECGAYLQGMLDELIVRRAVCGAPRYDRQRLRHVPCSVEVACRVRSPCGLVNPARAIDSPPGAC